jgi:hypothetical protein
MNPNVAEKSRRKHKDKEALLHLGKVPAERPVVRVHSRVVEDRFVVDEDVAGGLGIVLELGDPVRHVGDGSDGLQELVDQREERGDLGAGPVDFQGALALVGDVVVEQREHPVLLDRGEHTTRDQASRKVVSVHRDVEVTEAVADLEAGHRLEHREGHLDGVFRERVAAVAGQEALAQVFEHRGGLHVRRKVDLLTVQVHLLQLTGAGAQGAENVAELSLDGVHLIAGQRADTGENVVDDRLEVVHSGRELDVVRDSDRDVANGGCCRAKRLHFLSVRHAGKGL